MIHTLPSDPRRLARLAGLLYLVAGIFGGFAVGYITPMQYTPVDAVTTAGNVVANARHVRVSVIADLFQATVFVFLGMAFFLLLRQMHEPAAGAMLILYGYLIAQIYVGLWLMPLGYLVYTSGMFPRALGVMLIVAGVAYIVDMLAAFLVPDVRTQIHGFLAIPPTIAEVWMIGYLIVKGCGVQRALYRDGAGSAPGQR